MSPSVLLIKSPRTPIFRKLLSLVVLAAGPLTASTMYQTAANASDSGGALAGKVSFYLSNCVVNCTLNVEITNTEANPTAASQLISGLTFVLKNGTTSLTSPGTLSTSISNGAGGAAVVLDSSFNATTTMTLPTTWNIGYGGAAHSTGFYLNDITGGQPANMIIGPGPYTNANPSITGHSPSLAGTVEYSISGITGLTASTDLSSVEFYYGTGPDAYGALTCTGDCGGPIDLVGTPEPGSLPLVCGVLLLFGLARRRVAGIL